jgi:uncharacterized membrane protein
MYTLLARQRSARAASRAPPKSGPEAATLSLVPGDLVGIDAAAKEAAAVCIFVAGLRACRLRQVIIGGAVALVGNGAHDEACKGDNGWQ